MKAFVLALVAMVVIAIGADQVLKRAGFGSAEQFSGANVRL